MSTAALVIIGDEILSGKVKDENSYVCAQVMYARGVSLERIEVIPDKINIIGERVLELKKQYKYIITSGGVGPTHDDITFNGIAHGLNLKLKEHEEALEYFRLAQEKAGRGTSLSQPQKKMLTFPHPCKVYFQEPFWLPLVQVQNIYIFPGVPYLFSNMITTQSNLFTGEKFYLETIYTDQSETVIAPVLKQAQEENPRLNIGSYPQMPGASYLVMVTVQGRQEELVKNTADSLITKIAGRRG